LQAEGLFTLDSVTVADLMWHKMAVPLIMGLLGAGAALAGAAIGIRRRWGSARQRATRATEKELTEGLA
jgi:uncharacterized integral membrane protein